MKYDKNNDKIVKLVTGNAILPPDLAFVEYQRGLRKNTLIHVLFDNSKDDPNGSDCALIKYLPGAFTPNHMHMGYELVMVLEGEYRENEVLHPPGTIIIASPGSTHSTRSETGCTILAMRDIPVKQLT